MSNDIETAEPLPPKIDIDNSVKQKRDDIQLLRAFSILCVLIYHLNGEWLPFGYFGVDIFFVISGFLMAFIIVTPKNNRMTIQLTFDFYYRRVKRIVPTYLIVISLTLIVGAFLIYPLDRRSLADEAKSSLLFVLNLQSLWTKVEYFELITLYKFCTHLWSLCAELQFYIIVPPTFCLLFKMNQPLRVVFCSIIIVASFVAQLQLPDLFKHAFTPCRLWQFFIGILCFYVQVKEWNTKVPLIIRFATLPLIFIALFALMSIRSRMISVQMIRLVCTLTAALILWLGNLMQLSVHKILLWTGDHSYTIYLIHWPVIVFYKYLFVVDNITLLIALALTIITLLLTFIIDVVVDFLFKQLNTKRGLLTIVSLLYLIAFALNVQHYSTGRSRYAITDKEIEQTRSVVDEFYANQTGPRLTDHQAYRYNSLLFPYDGYLKMCLDARPLNESAVGTYLKRYICRVHEYANSNGKKILIVGNSHAKSAFTGIAYHFSDLYSQLELFAMQRCLPMIIEKQRGTNNDGDCNVYVNEMRQMIKLEWDIIFIIYKFPGFDMPYKRRNDPMLNSMNDLYNFASKHAKEVVFIPGVELMPPFSPLDLAMHRLRVGKPVNDIVMNRKANLKLMPNHRIRVKKAGCRKCSKVNWSKAKFCGKRICHLVHGPSKLAYFVDKSHISSLGSYYYGQLLREQYDKRIVQTD